MKKYMDHCRIGSLEIQPPDGGHSAGRSLPHRQLRNAFPILVADGR